MSNSKGDEVYEKTPKGQAIYNVYRKHGSRPDFFVRAGKDPRLVREIAAEWSRLEANAREKALQRIVRAVLKSEDAETVHTRKQWAATTYFLEEVFKRDFGQNPRRILAQRHGIREYLPAGNLRRGRGR